MARLRRFAAHQVVALDDPAAALEALTRLRPRTIPGVRDSVVVLSQEAPSVHDASLMKFGARIHRAGDRTQALWFRCEPQESG